MTLPLQNFVDKQGPVVSAAWLNEVDAIRSSLSGGAGGLPLGVPNYKYVQAQEVRSNTIVLADDTYLVWQNMPAAVYRIQGFLQFQGSVTGTQGMDFKVNTAAILGASYLTAVGVLNNAAYPPVLFNPLSSTVRLSPMQTAMGDFISFDGVFKTSAAGNVSLQWCQDASSANATLLNTNSWMSITQIG